LVQEVGCEKLVNVGVREGGCERLQTNMSSRFLDIANEATDTDAAYDPKCVPHELMIVLVAPIENLVKLSGAHDVGPV
jgi:hypothetical protein